MPLRLRIAAVAAALAFFAGVPARANEQDVMKRVKDKFPQSYVEKVFPTPYPGLYEVLMDSKLFYTDEQVTYVMVGNLIDVQSSRNLTQQRLRKLTAVDWKSLPLELAIKKVKGDGSRKLAVFSDPMCQHCIVQEKELARITNVTIYTFLYPIERLHNGSTARAQGVWCSPDKAKAWDDLMLSRIDPKAKPCRDPLKKIEEVGTKLKVDVTPTMIFGDGTVVSGGITAQQVEKLLSDSLKNPQ
jgi:thiol:disulfide interchange protein DsbC